MSARPYILATIAAALCSLSLVQAASAEEATSAGCRRYVPNARITVVVACDQEALASASPPVAIAAVRVDNPAPSAPASGIEPVKSEPAKSVAPVEPVKPIAAPAKSAKASKGKESPKKNCIDILDRALSGDVHDDDVLTLRTVCQKAG
jgi:hypothetical protein